MKVLLINGQNHKGSTYHIGRILAEKLTPACGNRRDISPQGYAAFLLRLLQVLYGG